jgi:hypothetical protein
MIKIRLIKKWNYSSIRGNLVYPIGLILVGELLIDGLLIDNTIVIPNEYFKVIS